MIKLYTFPPSTNSRKVRIALIEKGLEFERISIDLTKREQKNPDYLKINPYGQIPALDDEGFIVYDSTIINEYLEDEYPYPALMPSDSEGRARARMMEDFRDTQFNPYFVHIIQESRKPEGERDAQRIDTAKGEITKAFDRIESELQGNDYLTGTFSLADVAFMANIDLLERFDIPVDPVKYKNTVSWIARLKARPSFAASSQ
ncbi:MAG TPA: glutathione S-transferase family protein [Candidatus Limnocylindrales bacterium]|nr:glutathione S-transferase family protein [Candidatus Limnocylindrales bacterium]